MGGYGNMKDDYNTIKGELMALRQTYNTKSDEWIKDKLDLEKQISDLENSIKTSAGNGWDAERNRFKSILDDRDSQITNLKIECDVARSQHTQAKKESEDMKQKLQDYEKMNRYGRSAAGSNSNSDSTQQVDDLKKELTTMEKENKSALNNVKMKYDSKIAIMTEEVHALKSQASKYRRERETYKEMFEGVQKKISRLISDMDEFLQVAPKFLGSDILIKEERNGRPSSRMKDDEKSIAKMEFKSAILRVKETKEGLEQLHKISEEEVRKRGMRRGDSMESNVDESPRGRSGIRNASQTASSQKRALYRKAVSMGDGMAENANIWQSKESVGSNESLASNASIPLPIPVRTRSARGGSESGYSSDT